MRHHWDVPLTTPCGSTSSKCLTFPFSIPLRTYWPACVVLSRTRNSPSASRMSSASSRGIAPWNQSCAYSPEAWVGGRDDVVGGRDDVIGWGSGGKLLRRASAHVRSQRDNVVWSNDKNNEQVEEVTSSFTINVALLACCGKSPSFWSPRPVCLLYVPLIHPWPYCRPPTAGPPGDRLKTTQTNQKSFTASDKDDWLGLTVLDSCQTPATGGGQAWQLTAILQEPINLFGFMSKSYAGRKNWTLLISKHWSKNRANLDNLLGTWQWRGNNRRGNNPRMTAWSRQCLKG